MSEEQPRSPKDPGHSGQDSNDRFRRLSASDEDQAGKSGDTKPSRPIRVPSDTAPDEAKTIFPGGQAGDWTPAPPPLGHTPPTPPPFMDESGMPLPRRVTETDPEATQVSGAAYSATPTGRGSKPKAKRGDGGRKLAQLRARIARLGCLPRILIFSGFVLILLAVGGTFFALYEYA